MTQPVAPMGNNRIGMNNFKNESVPFYEPLGSAVFQARAAIAKAKGEQP